MKCYLFKFVISGYPNKSNMLFLHVYLQTCSCGSRFYVLYMSLFDFGFPKGISLCWANNSRDFKSAVAFLYMCSMFYMRLPGSASVSESDNATMGSQAISRLLCQGQHFHGHEKAPEVAVFAKVVERARLRRQTKKVFWVPFWQMSKTKIILRPKLISTPWKVQLAPLLNYLAKILANNCLGLSLVLYLYLANIG